jgi:hypothetical protein
VVKLVVELAGARRVVEAYITQEPTIYSLLLGKAWRASVSIEEHAKLPEAITLKSDDGKRRALKRCGEPESTNPPDWIYEVPRIVELENDDFEQEHETLDSCVIYDTDEESIDEVNRVATKARGYSNPIDMSDSSKASG